MSAGSAIVSVFLNLEFIIRKIAAKLLFDIIRSTIKKGT